MVEARDLAQVDQGREFLGQGSGQGVGLGAKKIGDGWRGVELGQVLAERDVEVGGVVLGEALGEHHRSDVGPQPVQHVFQLVHVDQAVGFVTVGVPTIEVPAAGTALVRLDELCAVPSHLCRHEVVPRRVEPLGTEVDHDVSPGERARVGATARAVPRLEDDHVATRFDQIAGSHQPGEARSDDDDIPDPG